MMNEKIEFVKVRLGHLITVDNDERGRELIASLRAAKLRVRLYGRHSNRKSLVGKVFEKPSIFNKFKKLKRSHKSLRQNVPYQFGERIAIYIY